MGFVASELSALADSMSSCLQPGIHISFSSTAGVRLSAGVQGQSLFSPKLIRFKL